jgi:hypothetical protein
MPGVSPLVVLVTEEVRVIYGVPRPGRPTMETVVDHEYVEFFHVYANHQTSWGTCSISPASRRS